MVLHTDLGFGGATLQLGGQQVEGHVRLDEARRRQGVDVADSVPHKPGHLEVREIG